MARNKEPRFINILSWDMITLSNGTLSDTWDAPTGSGGCLITSLTAVTDDATTSGMLLTLEILDDVSTVVSKLGTFAINQSAGTDGTEPVLDLKAALTYLDADGAENPIIEIPADYSLQVTASAINSGDNVWINVGYAEYEED